MSMFIGPRLRRLFALALVVAMVGAGVVTTPGAAAQNQTIQSQLTGANISYGPPYTLQPDLGYTDDMLELIVFLGAADILSIGFFSPLIDLTGARDILLEALFGEGVISANIDRGDYTGVSYSLDMMNLDGSEMGVFSLFMNNRSHGFAEFYIFLAPPSLFAGTMQAAQNSFSISGTPLMDGVDAAVMGNMVTASIGITGGTAVTDVTEVTGQTNTTETTRTTRTTQTTQPDANARATYLAAVQAEFELVNDDLLEFLEAFQAFTEETATAEEVGPVITATMQTLAGSTTRAAAIQPPAGMETFHQEFLAWAQAMTDVGVAWENFASGSGTVDDHRLALIDAIELHGSFAVSLDAELNATAQVPNPTAQPTQTTQTGAGDRESYLAEVQAEYDSATAELATILGALEAMTNQSMPAAEAVELLDAAHQSLAGTSARAGAIQPPAGMEAFHQEFLAWAQSMTDLGLGWADGVASGNLDAYNPLFSAALEAHSDLAASLEGELNDSGGQTTGQTTTTGTATRTTRTTTAETPAPTEATTATRTTRTTRTTTTGTADNERADYLQAVRAEFDYVDEQVLLVLDALDGLENETMTADAAVDQMSQANAELSAANQRITGLKAPVGMEDFHEQFLGWNEAVVSTGDTWMQFANQQVEVDDYIAALSELVPLHFAFGDLLGLEETGSGSTSAQASETPVATEATGTTRATRTNRPSTETTQGNTSETGGNTGRTASTTGGDEWLMPENDVTIVWDTPFALDEGEDGATESDPAAGEDTVRLIWDSSVRITISVAPSGGDDASSLVRVLETDEQAVVELFGAGAVLVDSELDPAASAVLVKLDVPDADLWAYVQFTCIDDCTRLAMVFVVTFPEDLPLVLADMGTAVSIDGVEISTAIPARDIEDSIGTSGN